jgi:hypothetical protein
MSIEHEHLAEADRHIAESRQRIEEQNNRIAELTRDGHPTTAAIELLRQFEETLRLSA